MLCDIYCVAIIIILLSLAKLTDDPSSTQTRPEIMIGFAVVAVTTTSAGIGASRKFTVASVATPTSVLEARTSTDCRISEQASGTDSKLGAVPAIHSSGTRL